MIVQLSEHAKWKEEKATHQGLDGLTLRFKGREKEEGICVAVRQMGETWLLKTHYYVGAAWLRPGEVAVQVQPKLNEEGRNLDHLAMLFACLNNAEVAPHLGELYELDLEAPPVMLPRQDDLLTPVLVAHFLRLVSTVVRQGLRKGYNPVKRELRGRVKGKIEVAKTLRQGVLKGRPLAVACAYEEFSVDIPENRLLKQALHFAGHHLQRYPALEIELAPLLRYCEPAFVDVSEDDEWRNILNPGRNPLYRSYNEALRVGQLLLRRFGYSLREVEEKAGDSVAVPPHWLDMSRLFELYVLGLLRKQFGARVLYGDDQAKGEYGLPDFLLTGEIPWIIDTKYKRAYQKKDYLIEDIRQLSGYARDTGVLAHFGYTDPEEQAKTVIYCLIVYPQRLNGTAELAKVIDDFPIEDRWQDFKIPQFTCFYKLAVSMPQAVNQRQAKQSDE
jgi:5-methylcytosine-specific restriction enzyme subunit McrC